MRFYEIVILPGCIFYIVRLIHDLVFIMSIGIIQAVPSGNACGIRLKVDNSARIEQGLPHKGMVCLVRE
jgi:hypothetical protein